MMKHKSNYKPIQFIPKSNNDQSNNHIKQNNGKLSYDEIRKIVENNTEKEIPNNNKKQIKNNFNIV
jgi:hypothetical protein